MRKAGLLEPHGLQVFIPIYDRHDSIFALPCRFFVASTMIFFIIALLVEVVFASFWSLQSELFCLFCLLSARCKP
eukprot:949868-Rhodomonas_salina.2